MSAVPKLAALKDRPETAPIAEAFARLGVTDADFPGELPDDLDLADPAVLQRYLPAVHGKLAAAYAAAGLDFTARGDYA